MVNIPKVDPKLVASVLDKAEEGPILDEKTWDEQFIHKTITQIVDEYDISWAENDSSVPSDDALADRLFEAGMDLALRTGVYCLDTSRRMIWTRDELEQALDKTPQQITVGKNKDKVTLTKRNPEENIRVGVIGGPYGIPVPEDLFIPVMTSYAQESLIDVLETASLKSTYGRSIRINSPWDSIACLQEYKLMREVKDQVGRPGISVGAAQTPSAVGVLSSATYGAGSPTDWYHNSFMSELKVTYNDLIKSAHYIQIGSTCHCFYNPIYGGYPGGAEGGAVAMVAGMLLMRACLFAETVNPAPSHAHYSCNSYPAMLPSQAAAIQAVTRNTNLITAGFTRPVAGPGEQDMLYEIAALQLAFVPSGISFVKGVHSATGNIDLHCSGLEARFMAQVAHAAESLSRKEADTMVKRLMEKYQDGQKTQKPGKPFTEIYDLDSLQPTAEWQGIYEDVCHELEVDFGLRL